MPAAGGKDLYVLLYLIAPWPLWFIVFVLSGEFFVYTMAIATALLALATRALLGPITRLGDDASSSISWGLLGALTLYVAFVAGDRLANALGRADEVEEVYESIRASWTVLHPLILAWIGSCEEIYWRWGLQENILGGVRYRWLVSSVPYALVHIVTGNLVLVAAAFIVGTILGYIMYKRGLMASIIAHVVWLQLIIVLAPLR